MERKTAILLALGCVNTAFFVLCRFLLASNPGSGPEGIGTAIFIIISAAFSALLSAFALNEIYDELGKGNLSGLKMTAAGFDLAPLLIFLLVDYLPHH